MVSMLNQKHRMAGWNKKQDPGGQSAISARVHS
jgi:hypothetical protein